MPRTQRPIRSLALSLIIAGLATILAPGAGLAQVPMRQYDTTLKQMLDAVQSNSYEKFTAEGDARFKANFTPTMFEGLARQLGPKLQQGYAVQYLTTLNQQDYIVYVWKLVFKGVKDDYLVTLFIKDGNVSGFVTR